MNMRIKRLMFAAMISLLVPASSLAGGLFSVYEENRQLGLPNYITEDFLLTSYSLIRQRTQLQAEKKQALPKFKGLVSGLSSSLQGKQPASLANQDYLAILAALLEGQDKLIKAGNLERAQAELDLILAAKTISASPLWEMQVDYSQFKPRGPYTTDEELKRYFRAYRYANTVLFAVKPSEATGVSEAMSLRMTEQIVEIVSLIESDETLYDTYHQLDRLFAWLMGAADDLQLADIHILLNEKEKYKTSVEVQQALFDHAKTHDRQPKIIGAVVNKDKLEEGVSAQDVLTGWRLLASRYSPDAAAFQALVYDQVTDYKNSCPVCAQPFSAAAINGRVVKAFPSSLELMAIAGSEQARTTLGLNREDDFQGYDEALARGRQILASAQGLSASQWALMAQWLQTGDSNAQRRLNSMLGFWTWQRYMSVLHSKQSYTLSGKGLSFDKDRKGARLAPAATLYLSLIQLVSQHQEYTPHPLWNAFADVMNRIMQINYRQRLGALGADDERYLNSLDKKLKALTGGGDKPIVVDVHTVPATQQVLQQAIGHAEVIWHDDSGQPRARGALMSHFEFKHSLDDRLTNEKWREILNKSK